MSAMLAGSRCKDNVQCTNCSDFIIFNKQFSIVFDLDLEHDLGLFHKVKYIKVISIRLW